MIRALALLFWIVWPGAGLAGQDLAARMAHADVIILGEVHDNPDHHLTQAELIAAIAPRAVVYEMLTPQQAARVTPALAVDADALRASIGWDQTGWPDFAIYAPVFAAYPAARVFGAAVPRRAARQAMQQGLGQAFGDEASRYGLDRPLAPDQQSAREAMQMAAHCDALPENLLAGMVAIQRLRDATLARRVIEAVDTAGRPVVVITGNGHARRDWGMPVYLARVRPDLSLFVLGQGEPGAPPDGMFDHLIVAPPPMRDDPCAAFRS